MPARTWPVIIGWDGMSLSERELAVIQEVALDVLRQRLDKDGKLFFNDPNVDDCQGYIECLGDGRLGTYGGVRFKADLPHLKGESRKAEFLVLQHVIDSGLPQGTASNIRRPNGDGTWSEPTTFRFSKKPEIVKRRNFN